MLHRVFIVLELQEKNYLQRNEVVMRTVSIFNFYQVGVQCKRESFSQTHLQQSAVAATTIHVHVSYLVCSHFTNSWCYISETTVRLISRNIKLRNLNGDNLEAEWLRYKYVAESKNINNTSTTVFCYTNCNSSCTCNKIRLEYLFS